MRAFICGNTVGTQYREDGTKQGWPFPDICSLIPTLFLEFFLSKGWWCVYSDFFFFVKPPTRTLASRGKVSEERCTTGSRLRHCQYWVRCAPEDPTTSCHRGRDNPPKELSHDFTHGEEFRNRFVTPLQTSGASSWILEGIFKKKEMNNRSKTPTERKMEREITLIYHLSFYHHAFDIFNSRFSHYDGAWRQRSCFVVDSSDSLISHLIYYHQSLHHYLIKVPLVRK